MGFIEAKLKGENSCDRDASIEVFLQEIRLRLAGLTEERTRVMQELEVAAVDLVQLLRSRSQFVDLRRGF
jgi:hypothetical protein